MSLLPSLPSPMKSRSVRTSIRRAALAVPVAFAAALLAVVPSPASGQDAPSASSEPGIGQGLVTGRVVHDGDQPVVGAEVTLVELSRRTTTTDDGTFRFEGVPAGSYLLLAESSDSGTGVFQVRVGEGAETVAEVTVEVSLFRDDIVVSAGAVPQRQLDVARPTSVLSGEELAYRAQATLGETMSAEPGVTSTYFGPGASRPVIRGLDGYRVQMLQDGLGTSDVSNTSPDHAVSVEPFLAERIEVLRGPATLLYGSSAVGGAVNTIDGRIPEFVPEAPVSGRVELTAGSVADERAGAAVLEGGVGRFAWHVDYLRRETDDYEIPGFAEAGHGEEEHGEEEHGDDDHEGEEEEVEGILENSAVDTETAGFGLSWVGDTVTFGASVSGYDTLYGVPGHGHGEEEGHGHDDEGHEDDDHGDDDHGDDEHGEEGEEEAIRIDLEQRRIDLQGEVRRAFGPFRGVKLRVGRADYEHVELEGDEVGTRFTNEGLEGRLELVQRERPLGGGEEGAAGRSWNGSVGLQVSEADFRAVGEEAFVPPSVTESLAVFTYQELELTESLSLQGGLRWETQDTDPESVGAAPALPQRSLDGLSASLGAVWDLTDEWILASNLARTERLPTANELYADGPHAATRAFEIGDPSFDREVSTGLDLSLRRSEGLVTGELTLFYNDFSDYIFESFTGEVEDGLEVIRFRQQDAEFYGGELSALVNLYRRPEAHFALSLFADSVRAELADGSPVPRIPALSWGGGFNFHRGRLRGFAEVRRTEEQDRVAVEETPTDGYTLVNASLSYRFQLSGTALDLVANGRNLTDEEARVHTSFLKDEAPLPGRDLSLSVRLFF